MSDLIPAGSSDRNLLFGILALQMDFIDREALIRAMHTWVLEKSKPLGQILREQNALATEELALLEALVQKHVEKHGNDPEKSLASVSSVGSVREELKQIADPEIHLSLGHLPATRVEQVTTDHRPDPDDPGATRITSAEASTLSHARFRILRPHAKGGLGEVFVAEDAELHRQVALKEIQAQHAHREDSRARFLLEAEITGGLEHPGIVPVYGLGQYADGRPFYAMRFIRGDSLKEAIAAFHRAESPGRDLSERTLQLRKLLGRFIDVCNAIAYAHSRGVLHRDLKPGNIMVGEYGETLVVDWGLAKPIGRPDGIRRPDEGTLQPAGSGSTFTQTGTALGTPAYMSPEQAGGRLDELGPASDVYGLGATLYSLLTGKPPLEGSVADVLRRVQRGDFPPPRKLKPEVSPALEAICLKAMALKQADRYLSPRALADDIEHWLADEPVNAWPEPLALKTGRWLRRHRPLVTATAATLLVAVVSLSVATLLLTAANEKTTTALARLQTETNEKQAIAGRLLEESKQKLAESQKKEQALMRTAETAKMAVYAARINEAYQALKANDFERAEHVLYSQTSAQDRGWEFGHLLFLCRTKQKLATERDTLSVQGQHILAISPDGKRIISGGEERDNRGKLKVLDITRGNQLLFEIKATGSATFSPDGERIVYGRGNEVKVCEASTGKEVLSLRGDQSQVFSVTFTPDGKRIVTTNRGDRDSPPKENDPKSDKDPSELPRERERAGEVKVWDADTGREICTLKGRLPVAFSPDTKYMACASEVWYERNKTYDSGGIKVWNLHTGQDIIALKGHTENASSVAFSPDGTRIVTGSRKGWNEQKKQHENPELAIWDAATGQRILSIGEHAHDVSSVAFSPDGTRIVTGSVVEDQKGERVSGEIKVWDVATGQEILALNGHTREITSLAFNADATRLVSHSWDGSVKRWNADPRLEILSIKGHIETVTSVAFSPDGRRIVSGSGDSMAGWPGELKVWNANTGKENRSYQVHAFPVLSVAFSPDGTRIVTGSGKWATPGQVKLFTDDAAREPLTLEGHPGYVWSVAFSPDGKRIVSGGGPWSEPGELKVWDVDTGKEILSLKGHICPVLSVAFSPDGKRIVSGDGLPGHGIGNSGEIKLWDVDTGKEILSLKGRHERPVKSVAFSPDGKRIVSGDGSGGDRGEVKVWDAGTGKAILSLTGPTASVNSVAFSPDGKRIASGSHDKTVKIWDATTGQQILSLRGHIWPVTSVAFSPDGKRIVSGSQDMTVKVWDVSSLTAGAAPKKAASR